MSLSDDIRGDIARFQYTGGQITTLPYLSPSTDQNNTPAGLPNPNRMAQAIYDAIDADLDSGLSVSEVAEIHGVGQSTVSRRKEKIKVEQFRYTCSDCGETHSRRRKKTSLVTGKTTVIKQSKCADCHAAYMRRNRPRYSELTGEQKKKSNCRSLTKYLIKKGRLIKQPCEVCGSTAVEAHHDDYERPDLVRWLCKAHHVDLHKGRLCV